VATLDRRISCATNCCMSRCRKTIGRGSRRWAAPGVSNHLIGRVDGSAVQNNLEKNPDGQDYVGRVRAEGRSDVLGWAGLVLAPRVQAVFDKFSERYDWGNPGTIRFGEQRAKAAQEQPQGQVTTSTAAPTGAPSKTTGQRTEMAKVIDKGSIPPDDPIFSSGPTPFLPMPLSALTNASPPSTGGRSPAKKAPPKSSPPKPQVGGGPADDESDEGDLR
jgi:hypothetical protein